MTALTATAELDATATIAITGFASPPPFTAEARTASSLERWDAVSRTYWRWDNGVLIVTRPFTAAENVWADLAAVDLLQQTNQQTLYQQAVGAWTANAAYLAKVAAGTAVTADHIAQVPALTQQMQAVIRLVVEGTMLDATT